MATLVPSTTATAPLPCLPMRVARALGSIGRFLIGAGIILLLFVGYQLWGTGLQHARAQAALEDDFEALLASVPTGNVDDDQPAPTATPEPDTEPAPTATPEPETPDTDATPDDETTPDTDATPETGADADNPVLADGGAVDPEVVRLLYPGDGEVIAKLDIPRLGQTEYVVEGVGVDDLRKGPGHYPTTPMPGQGGNAAIAGHRTTYGAPFHRIDELEPGDEIMVTTVQGTFTYRVTPQTDGSGQTRGHFIVTPTDTQVLGDFGDDRLTLTACHPKYSARQRIIVVAELVGEPEQTVPRPDDGRAEAAPTDDGDDPRSTTDDPVLDGDTDDDTEPAPDATVAAADDDDFGEGLDGDRDAIAPAISWMIAALAVWFTAAHVGRRWRVVPSYALALVPFLALLVVAFFHIDRALPSY